MDATDYIYSDERKKQKINKVYYPSTADNLPPPEASGSKNPAYYQDEENANRGYVEGTKLTNPVCVDGNTKLVSWNMAEYDFMAKYPIDKGPDAVNPVLWRMEKLNNANGLFQVLPKVENGKNGGTEGTVYQVRSYDLATMSIVKSDTGWVVIDPLGGAETAKTAWECFKKAVDPTAKVRAILITHSHVDHYKGVEGIVAAQNILRGVSQDNFTNAAKPYAIPSDQTVVIAPNGFYDEAISENLYLGNCMSRRAVYMYGSALPHDECGQVGTGLGKGVGVTTGALLQPSFELRPVGMDKVTELYIDGLKISFQDVPGTEAPAEFHIYIDKYKALCPGENISYTMHNLLTSRGAKARDPKAFANAIDNAIKLFPNVEAIIGTHHWPTWDKDSCIKMMEKQRDMYRFFNDQVIRMVNKGMNMEEIAEVFRLPKSLDCEYYNRGYYGSINHNVKAVVQRYVGWWDGNPANYFKYPDEEVAKRFVADMGGEDVVLKKAETYFKNGDYRWAVELTRQIVFCNSQYTQARYLQADALEQLAYSFESATWRNIFLSAAFELRGTPMGALPSTPEAFVMNTTAMLKTLTPPYIFDYFATLIKGYEAGEENVRIIVLFKDTQEQYALHLCNGVLHATKDLSNEFADVSFGNVEDFANDFYKSMYPGEKGGNEQLCKIYKYFDTYNNQWNIIEPLA